MVAKLYRRTIVLRDWDDAMALQKHLSGFHKNWIFRGQKNACWPLETTLERAGGGASRDAGSLVDIERRTVEHFKAEAHLHLGYLPEDDDTVEWLALIQHYGSPTRLLDFTRRFWVGVFFALELDCSGKMPDRAAVWAIESRTLWRAAMHTLGALDGDIEEAYDSERMRIARTVCNRRLWGSVSQNRPRPCTEPIAVPVAPTRVSKRMAAQGGLFVFQLGGDCSLEEAVVWTLQEYRGEKSVEVDEQETYYDPDAPLGDDVVMVKILLPAGIGQRKEGLKRLEAMGVNAAMLFPDLSGLARAQFNRLIE